MQVSAGFSSCRTRPVDLEDTMAPTTAPTTDASQLTPQQWHEVVAPPAELSARCAQLLPHVGVLDVAELEQLARDLAADSDVWEPLTVVDEQRRRYRLLYEDERIDVWVLSWMPGQGTGFHDHDLSSVGLACARGEVVERQMLLPTGATSIAMTPGSSRQGPPGYIHSIAHVGGEPAVTIHAYSPPLARVGQYRVDEHGILQRTIEHGRQELLDNTIAAIDPERA
jgi:predicted metal-dependent enzyme (double-stranded beta helix superfamily)